MAEINLFPYMDLVFMLLFVFLLVVPLLKTETPAAPSMSASAVPIDYVILEVGSGDGLILNGKSVFSSDLNAAVTDLLATRPAVGVMIKLAGNQPVQRVVELTAALREAGIQKTAVQTFSWSPPAP
jgi:biopolymer transport protein ExbD